ncbi:MAG: DEAD/DEAH box helicase [Myxococcales bacterium]|nr:DEAD/DEAH box helicase [Myxococcales bacterium]MBK7192663.1 DEAD/DEAH box helicase [Myxococcales bacterium]
MSRVIFRTGKRHQEDAAVWARQRLADRKGRTFSSADDQDGVLFADGVGLGKTWEALSAAALILYKKAQPKAGRRHVLILCPANLVTKWEDELADGSPFRGRLAAWSKKLEKTGQAKTAQLVEETLACVFPIRSGDHVRIKKKYGTFHPPGGTYIVSQSLITRRGHGLSALRREDWDVVIVDEAHNAAARKALDALQSRRRASTKLLLSATPFKLEPREWNGLAKHLLKRSQKVLNHTDVKVYIDRLAEVFQNPAAPGPKPAEVVAAGDVLKHLAARTVPRTFDRDYLMLMQDGSATALPARLDQLDDPAVRFLLEKLRSDNEAARDHAFETAYFDARFQLATTKDPTFVATQLRRTLATGAGKAESPRRRALARWARATFARDIRRALETGVPHKTIVFTAWVGRGANGEAASLQRILQASYDDALATIRASLGRRWHAWSTAGQRRFGAAADKTESPVVTSALGALADDELTSVLAGKHSRLAGRIARALATSAAALETLAGGLGDLDTGFEKRALKRRIRDRKAALSPWSTGARLAPVERYTGQEARSARDRAATAFREIGPPWVLVASNVGSEGIDLHTYTARIVHYDLEWNPAKMEQREGRGDRVGRKLSDNLEILYCLVPRTYDERMFHQLVARDRWHGVLLGKAAKQLERDGDDQDDAPLIDHARLDKMRLNLAPPKAR